MTEPDPGEDTQPTAEPDKSDLVAAAIAHGIPSYEAWAMTVDQLTAHQEA